MIKNRRQHALRNASFQNSTERVLIISLMRLWSPSGCPKEIREKKIKDREFWLLVLKLI
jgi:hypothetical protein